MAGMFPPDASGSPRGVKERPLGPPPRAVAYVNLSKEQQAEESANGGRSGERYTNTQTESGPQCGDVSDVQYYSIKRQESRPLLGAQSPDVLKGAPQSSLGKIRSPSAPDRCSRISCVRSAASCWGRGSSTPPQILGLPSGFL